MSQEWQSKKINTTFMFGILSNNKNWWNGLAAFPSKIYKVTEKYSYSFMGFQQQLSKSSSSTNSNNQHIKVYYIKVLRRKQLFTRNKKRDEHDNNSLLKTKIRKNKILLRRSSLKNKGKNQLIEKVHSLSWKNKHYYGIRRTHSRRLQGKLHR